METGRKTRLRRILRRKRIKRAIKAYGNYIAAGVLVFIVCVAVVGAAVKPTANTLPKNTPEPVQTTQPTESTTEEVEAYPFNLMSLDWDGKHWTAGHAMKCRRTTQTTAGIYRNVCSSTHT